MIHRERPSLMHRPKRNLSYEAFADVDYGFSEKKITG